MSTRKRNNVSSPSTIPKSDLPTPRKGKASAKHKTTPPFSRMSLSSFIYILCALALAFTAFQVWRVMQLKTAAGGWWNLISGRRPPGSGGVNRHPSGTENAEDGSVEDRINALAAALGINSHDLASAIAEAVKSHVPPASLSSVAAAETTKRGTASQILEGAQEAQPETWMMDKLGAVLDFDDDPVALD